MQYLKNSEGAAAKIALFDMKARIFPPLAGDQKSRLAYVDGKAETSITAGEGLTSASIEVGYVVACGVKDGGFESWIGTNQSIGSTVGAGAGGGFGGPFPWGGVGVGGSVNGQLGMSQNQVIKTAPGTIQYFPVGVKEIANPKPGEKFGVRFAEKRISVEGCIGSVDAVAYATGKLSTRYFDDAKTAYSEIIRLA
ncbi:MspA family protein [Tsukamurella paurometabola DSM 20162]|uniref:MspA family protein n=1 Tax=Tsukamurella paurometabola (strain ATCC 8368 / DSM 20162 / CCUG 35730 / CIP 100753 / JCM 10117 / KCTC 9821 / NBRC 16120 / NCIMB 702349 / NCTC 13040) TaxID=521096 RepID=D5UWF0_TSUPD|nr:MspA family protein [Tsukamurella paurometabola DSM 20162]